VRLASYIINGTAKTGVVLGDNSLLDLTSASPGNRDIFGSMQSIIAHEDKALSLAHDLVAQNSGNHRHAMENILFQPPLPIPNSIRDFSNFELHCLQALQSSMRMRAATHVDPEAELKRLEESGAYALPPMWHQRPYYFKGNRMTCSGHESIIQWPNFSDTMDYELEFAAIIGKRGVNISEEEAPAHIFGYTIYNDFSARDEQVRDQQFRMGPSKGKDFDTGNAMGPWIVTRDELPDPNDLAMECRINGEVQGKGRSSGMQFSFAQCIAFVSRDETLYPGDVFGSGTCGNGCGFETGRYLDPGDVIELEVEGIGILRNTIGQRPTS